MNTSMLKFKKVVQPFVTLREMKPGMILKIATEEIKASTLRSTSSQLKKEGYLFRISDRELVNETIIECLKNPEL